MKSILLVLITIICHQIFSQAPQGMNYQATVRNSQGNIITSQTIGIKFNIHQGSAGGYIVYSETQTPTTDQFGGIALVIGQGTVISGTFSSINWGNGSYFNEVLIDVTGGTNYVNMGTSQLMSVPYALYAKSSGTSAASNYTVKFNGVPITDTTINAVTTGCTYGPACAFLTKNNYRFYLEVGPNQPGLTYNVNTTDTNSQTPIYYEDGSFDLGRMLYVKSNILDGFYYIPLAATPVTVPNYFQNSSGHWLPGLNGQFYQLLPNDPAVTGFNLSLPVSVTLER